MWPLCVGSGSALADAPPPPLQSTASVPIKFSPEDDDCDLSDSLVDASITWAEYTMWGGKPAAVVHHGRNWRAHSKVHAQPPFVSLLSPSLAGRPNTTWRPSVRHTSHSRAPLSSRHALTPYPFDTRALTCTRTAQGVAGGRGVRHE